jgi:hypothetical protein
MGEGGGLLETRGAEGEGHAGDGGLDRLDLDGREPGETPIPHPFFIE